MSLLAAGAAAAGLLGVAGVSIGAAPWAQAVGNVAKTAHAGSQTSSNQLDTSALDEVLAVQAHVSQPTQQQPASGHASPAQPTALRGASKPAKAAASTKAASPAHVANAPQHQAPQHQAPQHQAPQHQAPQHQAAAHLAAAQRKAAPAKPAQPQANPGPTKPYLIYDSVTPSTLPAGQPAAVYADGAYAAAASQVAGHSSVLWIDTNGSDPAANVLDVEPGDATPAGAAQWVDARLSSQPHSVAIVYTMLSDWQQVQESVSGLPSWMQSHVRYWIADPTGYPHMVPGASATQWYWGSNYDITTANPNFEQQ